MPFAVLVGAMVCYLNLSRRLELVVARAAGVSAWQFVAPAMVIALLIGIAVDDGLQSDVGDAPRTIERLEAELFGPRHAASQTPAADFGCASAARTASRSSMPGPAASRASSWPA